MRVLLNGAGGAMGREIRSRLESGDRGGSVAGRVEIRGGDGMCKSFEELRCEADVGLDFSFHTATAAAVDYAVAHALPIVVGTTGHTAEERAHILAAAQKIPVFYTGNMSLGIAVLCKLVKLAVQAFPTADVEIVEAHHNRKADAPSGTAIMLARAVASVRPGAQIVTGRSGQCPRQSGEIGISSIRLGNTVGIHEVLISTGTQTITLKHEAHDRALFAQGGLDAAAFLLGRAAGHYEMDDLVAE